MTSFVLRLIAIIAMLLDHTAAVLVDPSTDIYVIMRSIGRIAFPIFCFLIVEGFEHTRSVWKYIGRMAIFAVLSEVPFDLAFSGSVWNFEFGQNVFLTLLLGLIAITAAGKGVPWLISKLAPESTLGGNRWIQILFASPIIYACAKAAALLKTDYNWGGVILICAFYVFRENRSMAMIAFTIINIARYCLYFKPAEVPHNSNVLFLYRVYGLYSVQWFAPLAVPFMLAYNGKPGEKRLRELFYFFYPVHLLVIWGLSLLLN